MKVGHILRLWNLILTSSAEPKMKPAVSLSNTPFISITEERQEAQKHQRKWASCAVSDAWELCRNSELPSSLLSESPQLSTSTLDLLTELCLASFKIKKKVPLFKWFFIAGWLWERDQLPLKLKWTYKYLSFFSPQGICNKIPHVTLFPLRGTFRHSPSASTHFPLAFCVSSDNAVVLCSWLIQTDLYSQICQTVHGEVSQHCSNLFEMNPILQ